MFLFKLPIISSDS